MRLARGSFRWAVLPSVVTGVGLAWSLFGAGGRPALLLAGAGLALTLAVLAFHRDPDRTIPPDGIVAPADGRITEIREEDGRCRVATYMGLLNVHVIRAPIDDVIDAVEHEPGAHRPAFSKTSERNERLCIDTTTARLELIAGAFARRITGYVAAGDSIDRGDRVGHISFSSRCDVVLPEAVDRSDLSVELGDRVRAGETVVAPIEGSHAADDPIERSVPQP